jgi:hypothetical protein
MFHHCYLLVIGCLFFFGGKCLLVQLLFRIMITCFLLSIFFMQIPNGAAGHYLLGLIYRSLLFFWSSRLLFYCPIYHFLNFQNCITCCLKYMYSTNETNKVILYIVYYKKKEKEKKK